MPDHAELFAIVHQLAARCNELDAAIKEILDANEGLPTVDIPVTLLTMLASNLRLQTKITARLMEENTSIVEALEKAARKK